MWRRCSASFTRVFITQTKHELSNGLSCVERGIKPHRISKSRADLFLRDKTCISVLKWFSLSKTLIVLSLFKTESTNLIIFNNNKNDHI